jgi:hypothetical protein
VQKRPDDDRVIGVAVVTGLAKCDIDGAGGDQVPEPACRVHAQLDRQILGP